jgi:hypothetical protein
LSAQKKQRNYYSGKKRKHTLKAQLVTNFETGQFMAVACGKGRTHDLRLFRESKVHFASTLMCLADKGYQGIRQIHDNSITPKRKPAKKPLPEVEKQANRALASLRMRVEHNIRRLKRFRILSERYRNRRRRFGLRVHLLAGIINYGLSLSS